MGSETPPEITVCEHSSLYHSPMQVKVLSCKEEAICEHDPDVAPSSLSQNSIKNVHRQSGKQFWDQTNPPSGLLSALR